MLREKRTTALVLLTGAALALSGCGRLGAMSRVDPRSVAIYPGGRHNADPANSGPSNCQLVQGVGSRQRGAIDLDCFVFPDDAANYRDLAAVSPAGTLPPRPPLAYALAVNDKRDRNRLTALLLKHSDDVCIEEMGRLTANEATVNTSLDVLSTAATTAANIVTGEQARSILAGVGTLAGASRSHINADVYRNTVSHAISRAITLERQRLRELIEARYDQEPDVFTVDDAIRAANQYHGVCSFYRGLELVLASVEGDQRARAAQVRRDQIQELEDRIRRFRELMASAEDKKPYADAIAALVARIQALTLAGVPVDSSPTPTPTPTPTPPTPEQPKPKPQENGEQQNGETTPSQPPPSD